MNKSDSIVNLAKALALFQGEVTNPKNTADNPFFKSKYCPLQDILSLARPLLTKQGLSVLQYPSGDGKNIIITTVLMHSSGEWIETEPLILQADKATAQGAGSAITYGRRYALSAILGISSEDDDDGNAATHGKNTPNQPTTPQQTQTKATTPKPQQPAPQGQAGGFCSDCNAPVNSAVNTFSTKKFGRTLCRECQEKQGKGA